MTTMNQREQEFYRYVDKQMEETKHNLRARILRPSVIDQAEQFDFCMSAIIFESRYYFIPIPWNDVLDRLNIQTSDDLMKWYLQKKEESLADQSINNVA